MSWRGWIESSRPSVASREQGFQIIKKYAIVRCPWRFHKWAAGCGFFIIVERGQRTARCPKCGHRFWLDAFRTRPLAVSDDPLELRALVPRFAGNQGIGKPLFYRAHPGPKKGIGSRNAKPPGWGNSGKRLGGARAARGFLQPQKSAQPGTAPVPSINNVAGSPLSNDESASAGVWAGDDRAPSQRGRAGAGGGFAKGAQAEKGSLGEKSAQGLKAGKSVTN